MTLVKLVNQARQMLEVLNELERGKAYDLSQLAEHVGVESLDELKTVAKCLQGQGCVELMEMDSGSFVALRSLEFDPGLVVYRESDAPTAKKQEQRSAIADASVDLVGGLPSDRVAISTKVAPLEKPVSKPQPQRGGVGDLTIAQILSGLAGAIEGSADLGDAEKRSLLENINAVVASSSIQQWLKTPLKNMAIG
ncbi:MAG: hypothetical protein JRF63_12040 [Deltaproteobacteria bacterium]|nr:hypothetical protein [Deltaproteobacteria bacterium]